MLRDAGSALHQQQQHNATRYTHSGSVVYHLYWYGACRTRANAGIRGDCAEREFIPLKLRARLQQQQKRWADGSLCGGWLDVGSTTPQ